MSYYEFMFGSIGTGIVMLIMAQFLANGERPALSLFISFIITFAILSAIWLLVDFVVTGGVTW